MRDPWTPPPRPDLPPAARVACAAFLLLALCFGVDGEVAGAGFFAALTWLVAAVF